MMFLSFTGPGFLAVEPIQRIAGRNWEWTESGNTTSALRFTEPRHPDALPTRPAPVRIAGSKQVEMEASVQLPR